MEMIAYTHILHQYQKPGFLQMISPGKLNFSWRNPVFFNLVDNGARYQYTASAMNAFEDIIQINSDSLP
jgi:hypothetical protein